MAKHMIFLLTVCTISSGTTLDLWMEVDTCKNACGLSLLQERTVTSPFRCASLANSEPATEAVCFTPGTGRCQIMAKDGGTCVQDPDTKCWMRSPLQG